MRFFKYALGFALPILMWQAVLAQPRRMSYSDTKRTIERIKNESDRFRDNFDDDVHRSGVDSGIRHDMKHTIDRFEEATENLKKHYRKDNAAVPSVQEVLSEAALIDSFMSQHVVSPRVQDEWLMIRQDLDLLATSYNLTTDWPSALARTEYSAPTAVVVVPAPPRSAQVQDLLRDIQSDAVSFQTNVRSVLVNPEAVDVEAGSEINQSLGDFMISTDRLKSSYSSVDAANEVLDRAQRIDDYMKNHPLSIAAQESWIRLRNDLIRLAAAYNLSPAWLAR